MVDCKTGGHSFTLSRQMKGCHCLLIACCNVFVLQHTVMEEVSTSVLATDAQIREMDACLQRLKEHEREMKNSLMSQFIAMNERIGHDTSNLWKTTVQVSFAFGSFRLLTDSFLCEWHLFTTCPVPQPKLTSTLFSCSYYWSRSCSHFCFLWIDFSR